MYHTKIIFEKFQMEIHQANNKSNITNQKALFTNPLYSDFKIICNDREIPVHRSIIHQNSKVFATMFQADTNQMTIEDIEGEVMLEMVRFLYTGEIENMKDHAKNLLYAAEKYKIDALKMKCVESLSQNLDSSNVLETLLLADRYNMEVLLGNCVGFIKIENENVFSSKEWIDCKFKFDMNLLTKIMKYALKEDNFKTIKLEN
jgi:speckle-type POZ protein